jgi:hypothetical protein
MIWGRLSLYPRPTTELPQPRIANAPHLYRENGEWRRPALAGERVERDRGQPVTKVDLDVAPAPTHRLI